ncbi:hypothetical protein Pla22_24750 [Rubripirellula amarantea]|uniref:Uncharacterized protein n=1 Tax=Rubripirellula amarantea TaxID=2527999 RepID=A0A5C5WXH2_9BACT|nr:hypothetical protein Pla22_24750 [Rubripirellula amarantea]
MLPIADNSDQWIEVIGGPFDGYRQQYLSTKNLWLLMSYGLSRMPPCDSEVTVIASNPLWKIRLPVSHCMHSTMVLHSRIIGMRDR